ncbi:MAG: DUF4838 domain-containing protein [Ruminococcaceae bacterium]|nr:DUF4838 domain-containing protein [Oscillospiraceae bacterium]
MKKALSLILAVLLLVSSVVSCDRTDPSETNAPDTSTSAADSVETAPVETEPVETEAPAPSYDDALLTENGVAKAHIVIPENAEYLVQYGADDLVYHIKKVSGADISVTNAIEEGSIPIVIATPDSLPELRDLFPEDVAWLETTKDEDGRTWADDGFSIRTLDGKIYIFGATARGALNGVYDFIEENMGVIWVRANEEMGLIYDEMPTITVLKTDYREKSPFQIRGVYSCGLGGTDELPTEIMLSRNKMNSAYISSQWEPACAQRLNVGLSPISSGHNVKAWVLNSPAYDPNVTEYWNTNDLGDPCTSQSSTHVNFWSALTADTVAAGIIRLLDENAASGCDPIRYVGVNANDMDMARNYPEDTLPFEYAPGQFVNPEDKDYISTVIISFMNRIAEKVAEKYPDVYVTTYRYNMVNEVPRCELADNLIIEFCTFNEDPSAPIYEPNEMNERANDMWNALQAWIEKTNKMFFYTYYGCYIPATQYERPWWDVMQKDFRFFAEQGLTGIMPSAVSDDDTAAYNWDVDESGQITFGPGGIGDKFTRGDEWSMCVLSFWLYSKLVWNPWEDVDALIVEFCDKVYGDASPHMQEYYRLLEKGWLDGCDSVYEEFNNFIYFGKTLVFYADYCLFNSDFEEDIGAQILDALNNAWNAADDKAKAHIRYIKETMEEVYEEFS